MPTPGRTTGTSTLLMAKTFKLTERFNLQFRSEFYNAFNHSNYYITTGNLDIEDGTGVTAIQADKGSPVSGGCSG